MILNTGQIVRLMVDEADTTAPIFLMRAPSVAERALFEAELSGPPYNAGPVPDALLYDALEEALTSWNEGDEEALHFGAGLLARARADDTLSAEEQQSLQRLEDAALKNWPAYQALRQRRVNREILLPVLLVQNFLVGWENMPMPFAAGPDGRIAEALLQQVAPADLHAIAWLMLKKLYPSLSEGEPSRSRLPSSPDRKTSPAAKSRRTVAKAGKSARKPTPKTRG